MLFSFIPSILASLLPTADVETIVERQTQSNPFEVVWSHISGAAKSESDRMAEIYKASERARLSKVFIQDLKVCYLGRRQNVPNTDGYLNIKKFKPSIQINEHVTLATAPVEKGCLYSGFGMRFIHEYLRLHKGWDIAHPSAVDVYAAGSGYIVEAKYRHDYGNMILINHGYGVFTRYAHLDEFPNGLKVGSYTLAGQKIGVMGTTADRPVGRHLHYEILYGNYYTSAKSFGLIALDILNPRIPKKYDIQAQKPDFKIPTSYFFTVKSNKNRA